MEPVIRSPLPSKQGAPAVRPKPQNADDWTTLIQEMIHEFSLRGFESDGSLKPLGAGVVKKLDNDFNFILENLNQLINLASKNQLLRWSFKHVIAYAGWERNIGDVKAFASCFWICSNSQSKLDDFPVPETLTVYSRESDMGKHLAEQGRVISEVVLGKRDGSPNNLERAYYANALCNYALRIGLRYVDAEILQTAQNILRTWIASLYNPDTTSLKMIYRLKEVCALQAPDKFYKLVIPILNVEDVTKFITSEQLKKSTTTFKDLIEILGLLAAHQTFGPEVKDSESLKNFLIDALKTLVSSTEGPKNIQLMNKGIRSLFALYRSLRKDGLILEKFNLFTREVNIKLDNVCRRLSLDQVLTMCMVSDFFRGSILKLSADDLWTQFETVFSNPNLSEFDFSESTITLSHLDQLQSYANDQAYETQEVVTEMSTIGYLQVPEMIKVTRDKLLAECKFWTAKKILHEMKRPEMRVLVDNDNDIAAIFLETLVQYTQRGDATVTLESFQFEFDLYTLAYDLAVQTKRKPYFAGKVLNFLVPLSNALRQLSEELDANDYRERVSEIEELCLLATSEIKDLSHLAICYRAVQRVHENLSIPRAVKKFAEDYDSGIVRELDKLMAIWEHKETVKDLNAIFEEILKTKCHEDVEKLCIQAFLKIISKPDIKNHPDITSVFNLFINGLALSQRHSLELSEVDKLMTILPYFIGRFVYEHTGNDSALTSERSRTINNVLKQFVNNIQGNHLDDEFTLTSRPIHLDFTLLPHIKFKNMVILVGVNITSMKLKADSWFGQVGVPREERAKITTAFPNVKIEWI